MPLREPVQVHATTITAVRLGGDSHRERGLARGALLGTSIQDTARRYTALFARLGIGEREQREAAAASLDALRSWAPAQHEEVAGIARGAGMELLDLGRTLARTEILTLAPRVPEECSTVAFQVPGASVSAQTWDWYAAFADCWHAHRVEPLGEEHAHAGLTEFGMPGKIGLNAAGVGVHLNILHHRDDRPGGVPVHAVLARVLTEAGSVGDGLEIIRSAGTTSSSVLTLTGADRVVMAELGAGRVSPLEGSGWVRHTNHFLAQDQQAGALVTGPTPTTYARLASLEAATADAAPPRAADDLLPMMCPTLAEGGVAVLPDPALPAEERTATLATVRIDPARGRICLSPGSPRFADDASLVHHLGDAASAVR